MKNLFIIFIFFIIFSTINTGQVMANNFIVTVNGINTQKGGTLTVFIFSKDGFPKKHEKSIHSKTLPVDNSSMDFRFNFDLSEFAVKAWHDEDGSGKITKNWTGIYPKEGLAFSKDQRVTTFGPPKFSKSKITRSQVGEQITLTLYYP